MKKLFIIAILFLSLFSNAQQMSKEFLKGEWLSETGDMLMTFKINNKKHFEISKLYLPENQYLNIVSYQFDKNNIYIETLYEENQWKAVGKYKIIDENTIAADIVSNHPDKIIYKRLTNK